MLLKELFADSEVYYLLGDGEGRIEGVSADSRSIVPGEVFVCIRGAVTDGHDHAVQALQKGASAVVISDRKESFLKTLTETAKAFPERKIAIVCCEDTGSVLAHMAAAWYGHPADKLTTIAITGTKGKTTTSYLMKSILENAGHRVGLIGTNEVIVGRQHFPAGNTTPEALLLQKYLRMMAEEGLDTVVMEVSSQALKLHRTDGILFDYGVFTNLSPDHIAPAEHRDFREYLECKQKLFRQCKTGLINGDDPYAPAVTKGHTCRLESFGLKEENRLRAKDILYQIRDGRPGVAFRVEGLMDFSAYVPLPGLFSVYNALCAISICRHFHVRESDIQRSLLSVKVRGRIETVPGTKGYTVLIDYAHNPMALESLLVSLRVYHPKRLICLIGCGGDRPVMRRRAMGEISGRLADLTVITDDNPRSEDPAMIREEIREGVATSGGEYLVVPGRRAAIRRCISMAEEGDLIVLAGKGHEKEQEINGKFYPMDEREIIREILEN